MRENDLTNLTFDCLFKVLLVGDSSVGKTSFIRRYIDNIYSENVLSTMGIDSRIKEVKMENHIVKLQIWDTAGQERFHGVVKNYFKNAQGIILIFDVTNKMSFDNISNWINKIKESGVEDVCIILVGNKIDLIEKRKVSPEEAQKFSKSNGIEYIETSVKNNTNVALSFETLTSNMYSVFGLNNHKKDESVMLNSVKAKRSQDKNQKCC